MKKIRFSIVVAVILTFVACQSLDFNIFPTFSNYCHFIIDETSGVIYEEEYLTIEDINDSIGDIQVDGMIESIDLEGFYLNFTIYEENLADSVMVNAYVQDPNGNNLAVFEDFFVDLSGIEENVNYPLYDYLKDDGVLELKNIIYALVDNPNQYEYVIVVLTGNSYPQEVRARIDVDLHFRINAKASPLEE